MTHYQKLATLLFRVIGVIILAIGVVMLIFAAVVGLLIDPRAGFALGITYGPPCFIFGWAFFALSKKLASWVCADFEKESRVESGEPGEVGEVGEV
jgi:hypothetical protein